MPNPVVAIVGRPNVGKSALFNRIARERISIVEDEPGITRDRIYAEAEWSGRAFTLIDTGGIRFGDLGPLDEQVRAQAQLAIDEADVILAVVDADTGITPADEELAEALRRSSKPVLLVANKADNRRLEQDASEFYALGLGALHPVSAIHGRGVGDLLDEVLARLPETTPDEYPEDAIRIAIIGRPNVGKSSLLNAILGKERAIVSSIPGTTRDAVDTYFEQDGHKFVVIDTAGIRRPGKVQGSVEYYTVLRALKAIERADVCFVVLDAVDGVRDGDRRIGGYAHQGGRGVVLVANKWDLMQTRHGRPEPDRPGIEKAPEDPPGIREFTDMARDELAFLAYAPIAFVSAYCNTGIDALIETAVQVAEQHSVRVSTGELNRVIRDALAARPPSQKGRELKIYYATMAKTNPPTIVLFVNNPDLLHFSYGRYLENRLREAFGFEGTPLRLLTRQKEKATREP
ncbi:MAG TPA: ribosome biogenesis GTPase Der [Armatimonadota bacterium]|nr:ribosome biogenesis GTPase Der [Armatimonadota bacterium]